MNGLAHGHQRYWSTFPEFTKQLGSLFQSTVKHLYYGHQGDRNKCPYYRGVRFGEVGFIWISVSQGPSELSVIERCPYYRGVRKERFHCISLTNI